MIVVTRELTKLHEEVVRGPLGAIDIGAPRGEYVLVLDGAPSDDRPATDNEVRDALRAALERGVSKRDAATSVAKSTGRPKREVYDLAIALDVATCTLRPTDCVARTDEMELQMSEYVGVASSGPSAAFFDLDRTLISGSSAFTLALQARKAGLIPNLEFTRDALGAVIVQAVRGKRRHDRSGEVPRRSRRSKGCVRATCRRSTSRCCPACLARLRPEARRLLDRHRHAGRDTFIVSAAPQEIVEPLAHSLGMTSGIGTRSHVVDGRYTGELDGPFCYGYGKVEAMVELANWNGYDLRQCYAYSDSASDLPMLEAVGHPVAVNPDARLERHARRHGWPIVIFSQQTKSVIRRTATSVGTIGIAGASFAAGAALSRARSTPTRRR